MSSCQCICAIVVVLVLALVFIILMSVSFVTLNYYEYGFVRDKTAGNIDTSKVYGPGGWYPLGPNQDFKTFRSDAHFVLLKDLMVGTNDKLEIKMTVNIVYFLRKHDLPLLLREYDVYYEKPIRQIAVSALKAQTTVFSKNEFILERNRIEMALFKSVRDQLEGQCCRQGCYKQKNCVPGCIRQKQCTEKNKGLYVEVRFLQLTEVSIPKEVRDKYMNSLVLQEATETEEYRQEYSVVQKNTTAMVNMIQNTATEILRNASAQAKLIVTKAKTAAASSLEKARGQGLRLLYERLNLTSIEHRNTFDYLMVLKNHPRAHISVDYEQMIAAGFK